VTQSSSRYQAVIAEIDAANAGDPRRDIVEGTSRPREVVYSERMSQSLSQIYPDASEELRIAARAQHICRWLLVRGDYPAGRDGYNSWRMACREHHATLTTVLMRRHGYGEAEAAQVAKIIKKEELKRDRESQALENVVAVVFARYYLDAFVASHKDYDEQKLVAILRKTLRKLDDVGHAAILALELPPHLRQVIDVAVRP
jgi:hypothetical protein